MLTTFFLTATAAITGNPSLFKEVQRKNAMINGKQTKIKVTQVAPASTCTVNPFDELREFNDSNDDSR